MRFLIFSYLFIIYNSDLDFYTFDLREGDIINDSVIGNRSPWFKIRMEGR